MDGTIYINSDGYAKRKTFNLGPNQEPYIQMMWEHCTAGFDNANQIADTKRNRAILKSMFRAHNLEPYFTEEL